MILAGDIGGTKTRLALFRSEAGRLRPVTEETYASGKYPDLDPIVEAFLAAPGSQDAAIARACFGVAGPVVDGRCVTTNLPWVVDARRLRDGLGLPAVDLINDLEANAYGIDALGPDDFAVLHEGASTASGNAAIIAAGTGLGEAGIYWDGSRHRPFACEGGHASFAPEDDLQGELLATLRRSHEHVSWERVLSGPGLRTVYEFLRDSGRGEEPPWLAEDMRREDPAAVITRAALQGRSVLCAGALDLFVALYGSEAGNLALKMMATGGLYVGGGIAPKILERLKGKGFMEAFLAKGRMRPLLERIPVRVILNDRAALLGAARRAALEESPDGRRAPRRGHVRRPGVLRNGHSVANDLRRRT